MTLLAQSSYNLTTALNTGHIRCIVETTASLLTFLPSRLSYLKAWCCMPLDQASPLI